MANNSKNTRKLKVAIDNTSEKVSLYTKASYFREKDKKAAQFLKKNPIPGKFLKG